MERYLTKDELIDKFIDILRRNLGRYLQEIILFGSRARGDYSEESDYDFIIIFNRITPEIEKVLDDICAQMLYEYGMVITSFAVTKEDLKLREFEPFIINALKEGVVVE